MTIDPRQLFPASLGEVRDVVPLAGGLSGAEVHAVTTATGKYVLRSQGTADPAWHRAVALQRLAADAGIAPALVAVDEATATTISAHIAGVPLAVAAADPAQRAAAFGSLVQVLARLHAVPLDPALAAGKDILATARAVVDSQRSRPRLPAWAAAVHARERAALDADQLAVLSALRDLSRIVYGSAFLRLVPDLTAIAFAGRDETPTLVECFTRLTAGALSPAGPSGPAPLGAA